MKSMNMYIDQIVTEATLFDDDINSLFYEIAMEEQVAKNPAQAGKEEPGMIDKMLKVIQNMIDRIIGLIQNSFLKFKNFLMKVAQSKNGFEKEFRKAFKDHEPLEAIKLITYDYHPELLEKELKSVTHTIDKMVSGAMSNSSYTALGDANTANDMDRDSSELYQMIFKQLNCPSEVKDLSTYFLYVKNKYRTNKKEVLFKSSQTQEYYQITKQNDRLMKTIEQSQAAMSSKIATLKSNLMNTIKNRQSRPEVKKRAVKQCKNATHLMNFYVRFVDIYMQLNLERLFTYRTVLKKLYSF